MDKTSIVKAEEDVAGSFFDFNDGSMLILAPYRHWGNIEGFDTAALYQDRMLEALSIDRPSRCPTPEESGFWSRGKITQQQLAEYWQTARDLARSYFDDRNSGKLDEETWVRKYLGIWRTATTGLTILELKEGSQRVFPVMPKTLPERLSRY